MNRTQLVAVWIANVGQVHRTHLAFAQTRRLFNRRAAMCDCCVMEEPHLLWRIALETYCAAICESGLLRVDWLADTKSTAVVSIEQPNMASDRHISQRFARPKRSEDGIVEAL